MLTHGAPPNGLSIPTMTGHLPLVPQFGHIYPNGNPKWGSKSEVRRFENLFVELSVVGLYAENLS